MHISKLHASFQYLGGKFSYLPWLLPLLNTPHKHFIDVFGGSGVVLINKAPAPIETFNDINSKVVNFFKVLRKNPEELVSALQLTPHSKQEYDQAWFSHVDTNVEAARKFFIRTQQSIWAAGAQDKVKGWCATLKDSRLSISEKTHKWLKAIENLEYIINRFKTVQIENRDYKYIMRNYDDCGTLFYLDSPYKDTLRSSTRYEFEFTNNDFIEMQYWCKNVKGKVAISGYDEPFMNELFKGFIKITGPQRKSFTSNRSKTPATECLWTNYEPVI